MAVITSRGTISVSGIEEAQRALDDIIAGIDQITADSLQKVGSATLDLVRARTPIRTGNLVSRHKMRVEGKNLKMWNDAEYAAYVEFGTSRMSPRAHWRPAIEHLKRSFPRLFAQKATELVDKAITG